MRHPINYAGNYYDGTWAGYKFKETLGYTSGVHTGVDYNGAGAGNADLGLPVFAIASGTVVARINSGQIAGFGNAIIIQTPTCPPGTPGKMMYHRYMHLQNVGVTVGQKVTAGQQVGTCGNTGTVWAHLHLDVWTDRNGLGAHWEYHKDSPLLSYEDGFKLIENNKNWTGTDMQLTRQDVIDEYNTNRGSSPSEQEIATHLNGGTWKSMSLGFRNENAARRASYEKQINDLKMYNTALEAKNKDLQTQVTTLTQANEEVKQQVVALQNEVTLLQKQLAECGSQPPVEGGDNVVITKDGLWTWFTNLINKMRGK